ncbi:MAG: hypothetical protein V4671_22445 [Armatimonadota bacterium]
MEEFQRLPAWIQTVLKTRMACDTHVEAAEKTGHCRQTISTHWKKNRGLVNRLRELNKTSNN